MQNNSKLIEQDINSGTSFPGLVNETRKKEIYDSVAEQSLWVTIFILKFILIAISIFIIVFLVRKIFVGDKYKNKPLKHP